MPNTSIPITLEDVDLLMTDVRMEVDFPVRPPIQGDCILLRQQAAATEMLQLVPYEPEDDAVQAAERSMLKWRWLVLDLRGIVAGVGVDHELALAIGNSEIRVHGYEHFLHFKLVHGILPHKTALHRVVGAGHKRFWDLASKFQVHSSHLVRSQKSQDALRKTRGPEYVPVPNAVGSRGFLATVLFTVFTCIFFLFKKRVPR